MKGLKINPCVGCANRCLRIQLLCWVGFDFDLQCWRKQFESEGFAAFWLKLLRTIFAVLKGSFNFDQSLIERVACKDEVDQEILQCLFEVGSTGMLPKDLAAKLEKFKITRHQVSRRILRMNKLLEKEFGELVVKKRGWHWALTSFAIEAWGEVDESTK